MELTRYASPLGTIFLAADNGALAGLVAITAGLSLIHI